MTSNKSTENHSSGNCALTFKVIGTAIAVFFIISGVQHTFFTPKESYLNVENFSATEDMDAKAVFMQQHRLELAQAKQQKDDELVDYLFYRLSTYQKLEKISSRPQTEVSTKQQELLKQALEEMNSAVAAIKDKKLPEGDLHYNISISLSNVANSLTKANPEIEKGYRLAVKHYREGMEKLLQGHIEEAFYLHNAGLALNDYIANKEDNNKSLFNFYSRQYDGFLDVLAHHRNGRLEIARSNFTRLIKRAKNAKLKNISFDDYNLDQ